MYRTARCRIYNNLFNETDVRTRCIIYNSIPNVDLRVHRSIDVRFKLMLDLRELFSIQFQLLISVSIDQLMLDSNWCWVSVNYFQFNFKCYWVHRSINSEFSQYACVTPKKRKKQLKKALINPEFSCYTLYRTLKKQKKGKKNTSSLKICLILLSCSEKTKKSLKNLKSPFILSTFYIDCFQKQEIWGVFTKQIDVESQWIIFNSISNVTESTDLLTQNFLSMLVSLRKKEKNNWKKHLLTQNFLVTPYTEH